MQDYGNMKVTQYLIAVYTSHALANDTAPPNMSNTSQGTVFSNIFHERIASPFPAHDYMSEFPRLVM